MEAAHNLDAKPSVRGLRCVVTGSSGLCGQRLVEVRALRFFCSTPQPVSTPFHADAGGTRRSIGRCL